MASYNANMIHENFSSVINNCRNCDNCNPMISDTCVNTIVPLVCNVCQDALRKEDATLPVVSRQLGRLCHGLSG